MQQTGIVIQTEHNRVLVAVGRSSPCSGQCGSCGGCYAQRHTVWVNTPLHLGIGDTVRLTAQEGAVLRVAILVYGLPLALFLLAACITWQISYSTLWTAVAACSASALGGCVIKGLEAYLTPPLQITKASTPGHIAPDIREDEKKWHLTDL